MSTFNVVTHIFPFNLPYDFWLLLYKYSLCEATTVHKMHRRGKKEILKKKKKTNSKICLIDYTLHNTVSTGIQSHSKEFESSTYKNKKKKKINQRPELGCFFFSDVVGWLVDVCFSSSSDFFHTPGPFSSQNIHQYVFMWEHIYKLLTLSTLRLC